jgi:anti-sigma regulatory factor (Ser/Thr protein kinase)
VDDFADTAEPADDITVLALRVRPNGREDAVLAEHAVLRNQPSELGVLESLLDRFSERSGLPQPTTSELRIVCEELVTNVMAYAYPNGGLHEIEVRLQMESRRITVTVADDGIPFDPSTVPPPDTTLPLADREVGGLGIHLVRHLVDDVIYRRIGARNETTLVKTVAGE